MVNCYLATFMPYGINKAAHEHCIGRACRGVARIYQRGVHTVSNIIVMAFSPQNIVGCFLKKRLTRGGGGVTRTEKVGKEENTWIGKHFGHVSGRLLNQ